MEKKRSIIKSKNKNKRIKIERENKTSTTTTSDNVQINDNDCTLINNNIKNDNNNHFENHSELSLSFSPIAFSNIQVETSLSINEENELLQQTCMFNSYQVESIILNNKKYYCVIWKENIDHYLNLLDKCKNNSFFLQADRIIYLPNVNILYFIKEFNDNLKHLKNYYVNYLVINGTFTSLENKLMTKNQNSIHSFLHLMKLSKAILEWINECVNTNSLSIFGTLLLFNNLFVNIHYDENNIENISHFTIQSIPCNFQLLHQLLHSENNNNMHIEFAKFCISKFFNITIYNDNITNNKVTLLDEKNPFYYFHSFFTFLHQEGTTIDQLYQYAKMSIEVIEKQYPQWPEIIWNCSKLNTYYVNQFINKYSIPISLRNENMIHYIMKMFQLTGTCSTENFEYRNSSNNDQNNLFITKPIAFNFKFIFDREDDSMDFITIDLILCHEFQTKTIYSLSNLFFKDIQTNIDLITTFIEFSPTIIKNFLIKLSRLNDEKILLLEETVLLDCLYFYEFNNHSKLLLLNVYSITHQFFSQLDSRNFTNNKVFASQTNNFHEGLRDLIHYEYQKNSIENRKSFLIWQIATWFIHIYLCIFQRNQFFNVNINDYIEKKRNFLYLFSFPCNNYFIYLIAKLTHSDLTIRPKSIEELINDRFFLLWLHSNDIDTIFRNTIKDKKFLYYFKNEVKFLEDVFEQQINEDDQFLNPLNPIVYDTDWNLDSFFGTENIVKSFTDSIRQYHNNEQLKGLKSLNIKYYTNNYAHIGSGTGVERETISKYFNSIKHLELFNKKTNQMYDNVRNKHWFTLGSIISHVLLSEFKLTIPLERHILKIMLQGFTSIATLTLEDLSYVEPNIFRYLLDLIFMKQTELDQLAIDFSEFGNPLQEGPLTENNVFDYINKKLHSILMNGYNFTHLKSLCEGFSQTEFNCKPTIYSFEQIYLSPTVLSTSMILERLKYDTSKGESKKNNQIHNQQCLKTFKIVNGNKKYFCYHKLQKDINQQPRNENCPLSQLCNFILTSDKNNLSKFLQFFTSSKELKPNELLSVTIGKKKNILPESRTCFKLLILYLWKNPKISQLEFNRQMNIALDQIGSFFVV